MFNLPDFVRHASPSALNDYCRKQNLGISIKEDGEANENLTSFIKSFEALQPDTRRDAQADLDEIVELANEKGSQMLIQKMQEAKVSTPKGFDERPPHDRAIWAYLNHPNAFRAAATHYEVENAEGWVTFRAPFIEKDNPISKKDDLAKAIASYFHTKEWRGDLCEIDTVEKDGYLCLVCHPQDYAHKVPTFDEKRKLNRSTVFQGTLKVYFLCRPDRKQLKVKAKGRLPKKINLAATFAQAVYGKEINSTDVVKYDLSPIKSRSFTFKPLPEVGVLGADVISLRLSHHGWKSSIQVSVWDKEGDGVENMRSRLDKMNLDLGNANIEIDEIKIKVLLDLQNEKLMSQRYKYQKGVVTVTIKPDNLTMKENDLTDPIESALRLWQFSNEA